MATGHIFIFSRGPNFMEVGSWNPFLGVGFKERIQRKPSIFEIPNCKTRLD